MRRPLAAAAELLLDRVVGVRRIVGAPAVRSSAARRALLWGAIAEPQRLSPDDARMMLQASQGSTRVGAAVAAVLRADLRDRLARLEVPFGVIWGWRDRIVPISTLRHIRAARPDVVVVTIPRAAHVPQVEQPSEFVASVRRLLARLMS